MAGDQVSQLETRTEPGPAENQGKSQSHHIWAETMQDSQTHSAPSLEVPEQLRPYF